MNESTNPSITFLSAKALGKMLNLSPRTVWRLRSAGQLPKPVKIGGRVPAVSVRERLIVEVDGMVGMLFDSHISDKEREVYMRLLILTACKLAMLERKNRDT